MLSKALKDLAAHVRTLPVEQHADIAAKLTALMDTAKPRRSPRAPAHVVFDKAKYPNTYKALWMINDEHNYSGDATSSQVTIPRSLLKDVPAVEAALKGLDEDDFDSLVWGSDDRFEELVKTPKYAKANEFFGRYFDYDTRA